MSYSGFKDQYGTGIGEQNNNTQYPTSRAPSNSTPSIRNSSRGYGASSYDWQAQNNHAVSIEDNQQLGNNRWRLPYGQDEYSYQDSMSRRSGNSAKTSNTVSYLSSTPSPMHPQPRSTLETPALNSLADASGLELADLRRKVQQRSKTPKTTESMHQSAMLSQSQMRSSVGVGQAYSSTNLPPTTAEISQASQKQLAASAAAALSSDASSRSYNSNYQMPPTSAPHSHPTTYASGSSLVSSSDHLSTTNGNSASSQSSSKNLHQDVWNQHTSHSGRDSYQDQRHQYSSASNVLPAMESPGYGVTQEPSTSPLQLPDVNAVMGISKTTDRQSISASTALPVSSPPTPRAAVTLSQGSPGQYPRVSSNFYSSSISTPSLTGTEWDDTRFAREPSPTNNYIDPTQVYNPFRQEHERMKAAEAEAEAQANNEEGAANQAPPAQDPDTAMHDHSNPGGTPQDNASGAPHSNSHPAPSTGQEKKRRGRPRKSAPDGSNASVGSNASAKNSQNDAFEQNMDPLLGSAPRTDGKNDDEFDMESEFKMMMKRIQEWRSKHPARFAKLMDSLKKEQAPSGTTPSQTSPQNGEREATPSTAPAASTTAASTPSAKPRVCNSHLIDGLPDLGRFPAQRTRRYNKSKGSESTGADISSSQQSSGPVPSMAVPMASSGGYTPGQPVGPTQADSSVTRPVDAPSTTGNEARTEAPTAAPSAAGNQVQNQAPTADASSTTGNQVQNEPPTGEPFAPGSKPHEVPTTAQPAGKAPEQPSGQPAQKPAATVWSEDKRQAVAKATSQYLVSIPANKGKTGSVEMILSLIDSNPSYIELCEQIEARGYVINRSSLAKHLLAAVPDLNSSNASQPPQHKPDRNSRVISQVPPAPVNRVQPQPPAQQGQPQMMVWNSKPPAVHPPTMHTTAPATTAAPATTVGPAPAPAPAPGPAPASVPAPELGLTSAPARAPPAPPLSGRVLQPRPSPVTLPFHKPPPPSVRPGSRKRSKPSVRPPPDPPPDSKAAKAKKRLFSEIVDLSALSDDEEEPVAKEPRLESSSQEPQADVSAATAQHAQSSATQSNAPQTDAPQSNTGNASTSAQMDLSRFALSLDGAARKEALRHRTDIVKPLNKAEALRRHFYNPKTIARDVLIAAGRHPTERPLNHHLFRLRDIFLQVDYTSDMETFRWDLVDPGGPPIPVVEPEDVILVPPTYPLGTRKKGPRGGESRETRDDAASSDGPPKASVTVAVTPQEHKPSNLSISRSVDDASPPRSTPEKRESQPMARPSSSTPSSSTITGTRRRGRPPGAKNKLPTKASLRAAAAAASASAPKIEVAIPVRSSPPHFSVYRCDWENCQAELHDLATLKRHVAKIHAPSSSSDHVCRWLGCSRAHKKFASSSELRRHLQSDHVAPIAWKLGDGPSVRPTAIDSERYLHDPSSGSIITPNVSSTTPPDGAGAGDAEIDSLIFPAGYTPIRAFNRVHGNQSNTDKARAVLKAVERMKVKIGPGLDQGGCELATPARNAAVGNDEGVFRLVQQTS